VGGKETMIDTMKVGLKIAQYRKDLQLTQDDLANRLNITRQALSKWENGTSLPSIELLTDLCQLFQTNVENLLCLNETTTIEDEHNLFKNHSRLYIINRIIKGEINVNIPDVFYQFSPLERMKILKAIKEDKLDCNLRDLAVRLTQSEHKYLFNTIKRGGII
jgi:DNA-binding XRE family transcriptional regulator